MLVLTPNSLLIAPCVAYGAGTTVSSLAKGYVKSTSCIAQWQLLLDKQIKHKRSMEKLYDNSK
jgi:hypothetical protein